MYYCKINVLHCFFINLNHYRTVLWLLLLNLKRLIYFVYSMCEIQFCDYSTHIILLMCLFYVHCLLYSLNSWCPNIGYIANECLTRSIRGYWQVSTSVSESGEVCWVQLCDRRRRYSLWFLNAIQCMLPNCIIKFCLKIKSEWLRTVYYDKEIVF